MQQKKKKQFTAQISSIYKNVTKKIVPSLLQYFELTANE